MPMKIYQFVRNKMAQHRAQRNQATAIELQRLKKERIRVEGEAKLEKLRQQEIERIQRAKDQKKLSHPLRGFKAKAQNVQKQFKQFKKEHPGPQFGLAGGSGSGPEFGLDNKKKGGPKFTL